MLANLVGEICLGDPRAVVLRDRGVVLAELLANRLQLASQDVLALLALSALLDVLTDPMPDLQLGYQKGGALTVAGLATLLTNALPIAAGSVVLGEPVPSGVFGAIRIVAFAAVTLGAILLARPERRGVTSSPEATIDGVSTREG